MSTKCLLTPDKTKTHLKSKIVWNQFLLIIAVWHHSFISVLFHSTKTKSTKFHVPPSNPYPFNFGRIIS